MPGLEGRWWLILIVLVIVLIIWGPGKLPDVGAGMGRAIREFRKASSETRDEFAKATRSDDSHAAPAAGAAPASMAHGPTTVAPAPLAQPAPVGGGTTAAVPTEHAAGQGQNPTAV